MESLNDLMDLVEKNIINNTQSVEQFRESIKTIISFLSLKGPIDNEVKNYLDMLILCSDEILSLKQKGVKVSTKMFVSSEPVKADTLIEEIDDSNHYSYGCSAGKTFHYSTGC